ncbi:MAG: hypothetical protein K2I30_04535 [Clostridia bacterium]|nr:hypothetical protein [Clostridia bacterium]
MKNYYAKRNGTCYAFQSMQLRNLAVYADEFEPLNRADAMKQFGYTDSCSMRVIKCTSISSKEDLLRITSEVKK